MHRALHSDLEPLGTVCRHYREAHGCEMIALQRKLIAALLRGWHELLQRSQCKTRAILDLSQRLAVLQWQLFLLRGWRRAQHLTLSEAPH
jgi:hypothetical protein